MTPDQIKEKVRKFVKKYGFDVCRCEPEVNHTCESCAIEMDIEEALTQAIEEERDACAKMVERGWLYSKDHKEIATAIRARGIK